MITNGHIGQVQGPFQAGLDLLTDEGPIGQFTPEKEKPVLHKIGIQAPVGTSIIINKTQIKIGVTGIYELEDLKVNQLIFPDGADEGVIIDFIYTGNIV